LNLFYCACIGNESVCARPGIRICILTTSVKHDNIKQNASGIKFKNLKRLLNIVFKTIVLRITFINSHCFKNLLNKNEILVGVEYNMTKIKRWCIRSNSSTLSSGAMFVVYPDLRTTVIKPKLNIYTKANQPIRVLFDGPKISPNF